MVPYQNLTRKLELFRTLWARAPHRPRPGYDVPPEPPSRRHCLRWANTHLRLRDCDLLGANCKILFESLVKIGGWIEFEFWIWFRSQVIDEFESEFDFCKVNEFEFEFRFFKVNEFELNLVFLKSMNLNLNLVFSKSMNLNLNLKIKKKMNGSNPACNFNWYWNH